MGLYEHWPYVNFHELNLDYILKELKKIEAELQTMDIDQIREDIHTLQGNILALQHDISDIETTDAEQQIQINYAINLCGQILTILEDAELNPNIGYNQNQTLDTDTMDLIYNAMQSYQMDAWSITGHNIDYGNYLTNNPLGTSGTPVDPEGSYTVCDRLDCSSFVLLSLMGIPYKSTGFNNANEMTPRTTFSRQYRYKPNRNPDSLLRWASDIYEMAETEQMLFDISTDTSQLRTGDVVFWKYTEAAWESLPDTDFAKLDGGSYKRVAHVGMIVDSCSAFASGIGLMQCVNTSAVMDFRDFTTYTPASLELMPYAMRPWKFKAVGRPMYKGLACFRKAGGINGALTEGLYLLDGTCSSYSGGRIPSNYITDGLDTTTGTVDTSKTDRVTTSFLPFTPAMVIQQGLTGVKYNAFYYDEDGVFQQYANNQILRPNTTARLIRLEFYNDTGGGPLTPAQKTYILDHTVIRYHIMADDYVAKNTDVGVNEDADTFYFFPDWTLFNGATPV